MKTYQDLLNVPKDDEHRMDFVKRVIEEHRSSQEYEMASIASLYNKHLNVTIREFQKLLYKVTGEVVADNFSANWKMSTGFYHRFVTQTVQFLLGNGVTWNNADTEEKLGKDFDTKLQDAGKKARWGGVSFGFYNIDHIDVFSLLEFAPLYDEDNGALMAGVRFWQVASDKPLRATFFEVDGVTDYVWRKGQGEVLKPKRPYKLKTETTEADGTTIYDGENYPSFPIVPLWANPERQSSLVGLREQIDCYDLIKSGFANDVDDASLIYWVIQNAGGMDDVDLAKFVQQIKTVHAATVDDSGATAEAHTMDVPFASREALLNRLRSDLYEDAMALDTKEISSGAATATQIKAAYEPLNSKADDFEYCVNEFIQGLLSLAGIEDEDPSFTRSIIINKQEEVSVVLQAGEYLPQDYMTRKILTILGDGDKADSILEEMDGEEMSRIDMSDEEDDDDTSGGLEDEPDDTDSKLDELLKELDEM